MNARIVEVRDLVKHYPVRGRGVVRAVDGVSFSLDRGQVLGLVGESGCGKSTVARLLVGLESPTSGSIRIADINVASARGSSLRKLRRTVQMVFQDPYASLNPRIRIDTALAEVIAVHGLASDHGACRRKAHELLELVGLGASAASRFPHELSGGQRQRVGIARALAVEPQVLVLDEPVSALDVSVRAEIMNLLTRLRDELHLTYVFISHDLATIRHLSDLIAVMYLGKLVEIGPWATVADQPLHPYSRALREAIPRPDPVTRGTMFRAQVRGEVADAAHPPPGCRFHPRCPLVEEVCTSEEPLLTRLPGQDPHAVACHVVQRDARSSLTVHEKAT